jgi:hypothetical protein
MGPKAREFDFTEVHEIFAHVKRQTDLLQQIWGDAVGYVFLPWIARQHARSQDRKKHWKEARAFAWPRQVGAIRSHLLEHYFDDIYFTPMVFNQPRRKAVYAIEFDRCWADLDEADPRTIDDAYKPSITWQTSHGRYAAVWFMDETRVEYTERGGENHKLTLKIGADQSGWDTTQLLRVPLSANNKPEYEKVERGTLVWEDGQRNISWELIDNLPELPEIEVQGGDLIDLEMLQEVDVYKEYGKVKAKVSNRVREFLGRKDTLPGEDRSKVAWECERELADAGMKLPAMVATMYSTPWNKFIDRADGLKQLTLECAKALAHKRIKGPLDEGQEDKPDIVPFWRNEQYLDEKDPKWLYDKLIPEMACGFIAGIPKSFKSWFALDLAISASLGEDFMGFEIEYPINVLYLQCEDSNALVRSRHHVIASSKDAKWSLDRPVNAIRAYPGALYVYANLGAQIENVDWQVWLARQIQQCELDLVIIDTLSMSAPSVDTSSTEIVGKVLKPMKDIARDNDCGLVFVHHNTKAGAYVRAGQNMAGSGQLHAWADFGLYIQEVKPHPGGATVLLESENKFGTSASLKFQIDGLDRGTWNPYEVTHGTFENSEEEPSWDEGVLVFSALRKMVAPQEGRGRFPGINQVMEFLSEEKITVSKPRVKILFDKFKRDKKIQDGYLE